MPYTTIISPDLLAQHLQDPEWVVIDCRFSLADKSYGQTAWNQSHIPGSRFVDLEEDLSGEITDSSGRHPLPSAGELVDTLARLGIGNNTQVVIYDDAFGSMAVRLWWTLRWLGMESVALLDGGFPRWKRENRPLTDEKPLIEPGHFAATVQDNAWVDCTFVENCLNDSPHVLIDARGEDRYAGERDPLDPVKGHIPGSLNRPFEDNLDLAGNFLSAEELREEFEALLGDTPPENVIHTCGSGVTCCHNMLAMEIAGLSGSRSYVGSWSKWITDPAHPIATGDEPG